MNRFRRFSPSLDSITILLIYKFFVQSNNFSMFSVLQVSVAIAAFYSYTNAHPAGDLEGRNGVCSNGIYGELLPCLATYPIAIAFCQAVYPVKCAKSKRTVRTTSITTTSSTSTKTTTKSSTATQSNKVDTASAWSECQKQPGNVVSTMCSCILPSPKVSRPPADTNITLLIVRKCTGSQTTTTVKV